MLIIVALLTNMLVTNLCLMFGVASDAASNIGMIGMIIAALVMYNRFNKRGRRK
ncbi:hypothetical protein D3C71_1884250 [compost metagenome]